MQAASSWSKIDSDQEQQLASMFGIRSIPHLCADDGRQAVDGFMGAQPEGKLREFLDKHLPSGRVDGGSRSGRASPAGLVTPRPHCKVADALAADPANDDARFDYVRLLIATGSFDEARLLAEHQAHSQPLRFEALNQWLKALEFAMQDDNADVPSSMP